MTLDFYEAHIIQLWKDWLLKLLLVFPFPEGRTFLFPSLSESNLYSIGLSIQQVLAGSMMDLKVDL